MSFWLAWSNFCFSRTFISDKGTDKRRLLRGKFQFYCFVVDGAQSTQVARYCIQVATLILEIFFEIINKQRSDGVERERSK